MIGDAPDFAGARKMARGVNGAERVGSGAWARAQSIVTRITSGIPAAQRLSVGVIAFLPVLVVRLLPMLSNGGGKR
jgi:hypothetical protein